LGGDAVDRTAWGDEAIAGAELEDVGLAPLAPEDLGAELPPLAAEHLGQEEREVEAVFLHGGEEAEGAVELDEVAALAEIGDAVEQAVEARGAEQLPDPAWLLAVERDRH